MRSLGSFLHVVAWGVPAAQTVAALVRRDVDTDELTGKFICFLYVSLGNNVEECEKKVFLKYQELVPSAF